MKALVVREDHRLELRDIPAPTAGRFEALVKILACGICSTTDTEIIRGTQPYHKGYPCLLGHEAIGEVVSIGPGVTTFRPGDRVTRPTGIWPGTSRDGLVSGWGGFAEYGIVRDRQALAAAGDGSANTDYTTLRQNVVPPGLSVEEAVAAIALAETLSWTRNLGPLAGKRVCIAGTGIAGLSILLWCKLLGAASVVVLGRRATRLALARDLGADHGVHVREQEVPAVVKEITGGGADLFLEATGQADQLRVGCSVVRPGGTIAVYGVPPQGKYDLEWKWLPSDIRFLKPSADEHLAYAEVADLIVRRKIPVDKLMTHRWAFSQFDTAFDAVGRGEVVKGMLVIAEDR